MLGGQVKLQVFTLAYGDGYIAIAFVAAHVIILIAFMKPMKIYFDAPAADKPNPLNIRSKPINNIRRLLASYCSDPRYPR